MAERVCLIVNPAAGRGRGARTLRNARAAFEAMGVTDVRHTTRKGEEREIASRAIGDGATTLMVAGGDGTTSNVANAILNSGTDVRLGVVPAGTGNDFAKVLGVSEMSAEWIARLSVESASSRLDVGKIEGHFFLNSCGFGFDVAVLEDVTGTQWLRGNAVYLYSALRQLFGFRGLPITVDTPDEAGAREMHMLLVVANTQYFGGMFTVAPGASATDGLLDAVSVHDVTLIRRMGMLASVARGSHLARPECMLRRAEWFSLSFDQAPAYQVDGELRRAMSSSVRVSSCPAALRVVSAPNSGLARQQSTSRGTA